MCVRARVRMCVHVPRCVNEDVDDQKHSDEISDSACENEQLCATLHALTAVVSSLCTYLVLCARTLYLPRSSMLRVSCGFARFFHALIYAVCSLCGHVSMGSKNHRFGMKIAKRASCSQLLSVLYAFTCHYFIHLFSFLHACLCCVL